MIVGKKLMIQMSNDAVLQIAVYMRVLLLFNSVRDVVD